MEIVHNVHNVHRSQKVFRTIVLKCFCGLGWRRKKDQFWRCLTCDPPVEKVDVVHRTIDFDSDFVGLSISGFSHADCFVRWWSPVLDEHVWFVPLKQDLERFWISPEEKGWHGWMDGEVAYTAHEMLLLVRDVNLGADTLKAVHAIKKALGGEICHVPLPEGARTSSDD